MVKWCGDSTPVCSLLLAWQLLSDTPVALAANRDERYDRPANGPRLLSADPRVLAPIDHTAGGTWIGVNEHGLVVALANRRDGPEGERSRGQLVRDLLGTDTSDEARTFLASLLAEHQYAGFHLLLVDPFDAFYATWDGTLDGIELHPGVHVLDNEGLDEDASISRDVRGRLEPSVGESADEWLERATAMLADHDLGLCRHEDEFGTVSATRIAVHDKSDAFISFDYAGGPPCTTAFEDVTPEGHI